MAVLEYTARLPNGRTGGQADGDNRWTYHHVLPWRYYYFTAHTLVVAARYELMSNPGQAAGLATHAWGRAIAETADRGPAGARRQYGSSAEGFGAGSGASAPRRDYPPARLLEMVLAMTAADDATMNQRVPADQPLDPQAIASLCIGPRFGGFSGMDGQDRLDDPGDGRELLRPCSFPLAQWGLLNLLGQVLEGFAPALATARENREFDVRLTEDFWTILLPTLDRLIRSFNAAVHPFVAPDWDYLRNRTNKVPWVYIEDNEAALALVRGQLVGRHFRLNRDGRGDESLPPGEEAVGMVRGVNQPGAQNGNRLCFLTSANANWAGGPRARTPGAVVTTTPQIAPR